MPYYNAALARAGYRGKIQYTTSSSKDNSNNSKSKSTNISYNPTKHNTNHTHNVNNLDDWILFRFQLVRKD